jgi:hypothetical protein
MNTTPIPTFPLKGKEILWLPRNQDLFPPPQGEG